VAFMNTYIPAASATTGLYQAQVPDPTNGNQYTVRVDFRTTKRDQTYVRVRKSEVANQIWREGVRFPDGSTPIGFREEVVVLT
jgi:hypothetical protein